MNKKILGFIKFAIFLGLGIFLVWWSIEKIPADQQVKFKQSLRTANYWMILPVFLILSTSHFLRALRWKLLMKPMGYNPSLINTFFAVMIGYLANNAFPRLGEVLKCTILAKYEQVPADKNVGTIVAERAFDLLCLLGLFAVALLWQYDVVIAAYNKMQHSATSHADSTTSNTGFYFKIGLLAVAVIVLFWAIATKKIAIFFAKIKQIAKGILEGLTSAWKLENKYLFLFYSISIWILYVLGTWIGMYATKGTEVGLGASVACLAFASIGMILTPGGIGSYAILLSMVLELYGIEPGLGIANGTLQWFAQFIIILIVGFVCVILLPVYNRAKAK